MSSPNTLRITEVQKKQYQDEGFFILEKIIPEKELEFLRSECDYHIAQQNAEMDRLGVDVLNLSRRNSRYFVFLAYKDRPQLGEFLFSDRMAALCCATIGDNAFLFWEQFVVKGTDKKGAEFGWHQDSGYVDYIHRPYVNFWIPLEDVNEKNGTIYLLSYDRAGTREKVQHQPVPGTNDRVGYFGSDPGVPAICPAGSIVVFSSTVFHRSGANFTNKMRRAYAVQYSPEVIYEADGSLKGLDVKFLKNGQRV